MKPVTPAASPGTVSWHLEWLLLGLVFAGALALRVVPPWDQVVRGDRILLLANDPWIHAHQVDDILRDFPRVPAIDPHRLHPAGQAGEAPLFPLALAGAAWVLGRGAPSPALVDRVLAWVPALLGALVVLPVARLGRRAFGVPAGLLAAALVAVLPGQLLQRSLFGYTDHHVAESLLSLLALACLAAALDGSGTRRWLWSALGGLWLGAYLLTWARGFVLFLVLAAWATAQVLLEHGCSSRAGGPVWRAVPAVLGTAFGAAFFVTLPFAGRPELRTGATLLLLAILALGAFTAIATFQGQGRARLMLVLGAAAIPIVALVLHARPDWLDQLMALGARLQALNEQATIGEARPLLFVTGAFSLEPLWLELASSSALGVVGLVLLARRALGERRPTDTLLLAWSLAALGLALAQLRFGYYLAPVVALLAAGAATRLVRGLAPAFGVAAALCLAVYPPLPLALAAARTPEPGPSPDWVATLDWLRTNTPRPGPELRYGVLAWCDFGYWITRLGERVPVANPTQHGAREVADVLLETEETRAREKLRALGARYLVLDRSLLPEPHGLHGPFWLGKLDSLARWAHRDPSDYYQVLFDRDSAGALQATVVYTPAYYRSLLVRLYVFAGAAVPSTDGWVVEVERRPHKGRQIEVLRSARRARSAAETEGLLTASVKAEVRLAGRDPFRPSLPLDALAGFELLYASPGRRVLTDGRALPEIVVFAVELESHDPAQAGRQVNSVPSLNQDVGGPAAARQLRQ